MNPLFILVIIVVVVNASPDAEALRIAINIEYELREKINKGDAEGIGSHFSEDFKYKYCNGRVSDRREIVKLMLQRITIGTVPKFYRAEKISDSKIYYMLIETSENGTVLRNSERQNTAENIGGKWIVTSWEVLKCN